MLQPKILEVIPMPEMCLLLKYENGEVKQFDVSPYATGSWYGELRQKSYFNSVRLLAGGVGIEWPDGQDISPHELYEQSVTVSE